MKKIIRVTLDIIAFISAIAVYFFKTSLTVFILGNILLVLVIISTSINLYKYLKKKKEKIK